MDASGHGFTDGRAPAVPLCAESHIRHPGCLFNPAGTFATALPLDGCSSLSFVRAEYSLESRRLDLTVLGPRSGLRMTLALILK